MLTQRLHYFNYSKIKVITFFGKNILIFLIYD